MPDFTTLTIEEKGPVCHLTLSRPGQGNRIDVAMVRELEEACYYLEDDSPASLVVVRGTGGTFTEGIDFSEFSLDRPPDTHGFHRWERALATLEKLAKVTIAVIEGECRGGGVQLALACDLRLAADSARLTLDEVKLGFLPGLACYRLPRYVGLGRAKELLFTARTLAAQEALAWGLLDRVAGGDRLEAALQKLLADCLPVNPTAVHLARRLLNESFPSGYEDFLGSFLAAQARAVVSEPFLRHFQQAIRPPE